MGGEKPREMACADPQSCCQQLNRAAIRVEGAFFNNQSNRPVDRRARAVPGGAEWGSFRSAPKTGPKPATSAAAAEAKYATLRDCAGRTGHTGRQ
jgi:hypothetical protein